MDRVLRPAGVLALLLVLGAPAAAAAQEMRHRHLEHAVEGYLLGSFGASLSAVRVDGEVRTEAAWLQPQVGVGVSFPTNPWACLGLGSFGFELVLGPAVALGSGLTTELQVAPGMVLELSADWPLQLLLRASLVAGTAEEGAGFSGAALLGWYARPVSVRLGIEYQQPPGTDLWLTGVRLEILWLGEDPHPPGPEAGGRPPGSGGGGLGR